MSTDSKVRKAIQKATDPSLRGDNWAFIIDVCDLVKEDPEERGDYAMKMIEEELKGRDANVLLRSLSLVVALAENCGSRLKQTIGSKHFTGVLFKMVEDRKVHIDVKRQVLKTVTQLSDSFQGDPSLKYMHDLQLKIERKHPSLMIRPYVPEKTQLSAESKSNEDRQLEEALRLSLLEYKEKNDSTNPQQSEEPRSKSSGQLSENTSEISQKQQPSTERTTTIIRKVRAMYDLTGSEPDELSFRKGDVITVVEQVYRDWWKGTLRGKVGIFPLNYVTPVLEPTYQEKQAEKQKEEELLSQKSTVAMLHQRLRENSNVDVTQDQEINALYGKVTPLRPDISKMLAKYAQKKEDLVSLRQIMLNAEATYNQLLSRATNVYTSPAIPTIGQRIPAYEYNTMAQNPPPNSQLQNPNPNVTNPMNKNNIDMYPPNLSLPSTTHSSIPLEQQNQHHLSTNQHQQQNYRFAQLPSSPYPMSTQNTGL